MNNYALTEEIGRGKYSIVYKGRKKQTIEYYAIKSVEKVHREKVLNEVSILHQLDHANILKFYNWYETPNHLWLIVEYCSGGDLMNVLLQDNKLPECTIQMFAKDLLSGLHYLHSQGIIYCDLKPSNILFDGTGILKFCDFGLSRNIQEIINNELVPQTKRGTPCYMSPESIVPEVFSDDVTIIHTFASDIWSLGCVLYELAAGKPPYVSTSFTELMNLILQEPFTPVPNLSNSFNDLLEGLLKKDPADRLCWDQILDHPCWNFHLELLPLPPQPHFDKYLLKKQQRAISTIDTRASISSISSTSPTSSNSPNSLLLNSIGKYNSIDNHNSTVSNKQSLGKNNENNKKDISNNNNNIIDSNKIEDDNNENETNNNNTNNNNHNTEIIEETGLTTQQHNLILMSQKASRNIEKEREGTTYYVTQRHTTTTMNEQSTTAVVDVQLSNPDVELNFEEQSKTMTRHNSGIPKITQLTNENDQYEKTLEEFDHADRSEFSDTSEEEIPATKKSILKPLKPVTPRRMIAQLNNNNNNNNSNNNNNNGNRPSSVLGALKKLSTKPGSSHGNHYNVNNSNSAPNSRSGTPRVQTPNNSSVDISKLIYHSSDKTVKPIVEPKLFDLYEFTWSQRVFPVLSLSKMLTLSQSELEHFLTQIYKALASKCTITLKLQYLNYFETLCVDPKSANLLVNSSLLSLFVTMIRTSKIEGLKTKLLHVIGVLIRHATVISKQLQELQLINILTDLLRDKEMQIRRSAMACLGELLFYITTQESSEDTWTIPTTTVNGIIKCIKTTEDELVLQYAIQTIENITSSVTDYSRLFCTMEVVQSLYIVFNNSQPSNLPSSAPSTPASNKPESPIFNHFVPSTPFPSTTLSNTLRVIAASTISRICRINTSLLFNLIDKTDIKIITDYLSEGNSKVQQSFLNLFNLLLVESPAKTSNQILEEQNQTIVPVIRKLLEHSQSTIRAKALLSIYMIIKIRPLTFLLFCEFKVLSIIERISKDKETYVRHCMKIVIQSIMDLVPIITNQITIDIKSITDNTIKKRSLSANSNHSNHSNHSNNQQITNIAPLVRKSLQEHISVFPILLHLMTSPFLRYRIFTGALIEDLSFYLTTIEQLNFLQPDDFKSTLLLLLEAISQNPSTLVPQYNSVLVHLLPALINLLQSENGDTRFLCLKIFIDVLSEFLSHPNLYSTNNDSTNITTKQINDIINKLLPNFKLILCDEDPIPPFGLKLLNIILERNPTFLTTVYKLNLIPMFFKFFQLDNPNNNIHNMKLIKKVVESTDIDKKLVYDLGIIKRLGTVFEYAFSKSVDSFLEPILDIISCLLSYSASSKNSDYLQYNQSLLDYLTPIIKLINHNDPLLSEKAARCLEINAKLYLIGAVTSTGQTVSEVILSPPNISLLNNALERGSSNVVRYVLATFKDLVSNHNKITGPIIAKEVGIIENLKIISKGSKGNRTALLANEILKFL